ncbi:MAG: DUF4249 family protein [bacterium]
MKKFKFIYISVLFAVCLLFIQSCENVIDGQLPYEEKLVIKCILEEGKPVDNIFIAKTLPPMYKENYYSETSPDIIVENAVGYISDSEKSYQLVYVGNSIYKAVDLVPKEGVAYHLNVTWNGHTATSQTYVPKNPEILSLEIKKGDKEFYGDIALIKIKGIRNTSYITLTYSSGQFAYYNYSIPIFLGANSSSDTVIVIANQINDVELDRYMVTEIVSFPPEFLDFYNSKNIGGNGPDGLFTTSGINVKWNIKGDGIGLFLGQNKLSFKIEDYLNK